MLHKHLLSGWGKRACWVIPHPILTTLTSVSVQYLLQWSGVGVCLKGRHICDLFYGVIFFSFLCVLYFKACGIVVIGDTSFDGCYMCCEVLWLSWCVADRCLNDPTRLPFSALRVTSEECGLVNRTCGEGSCHWKHNISHTFIANDLQ